VVIPLERLSEYNDGIERINIILSTQNKLVMIGRLLEYFASDMPELRALKAGEAPAAEESEESRAIFNAKIETAVDLLQQVRHRWQAILENMDALAIEHPLLWQDKLEAAPGEDETFFYLLQRRQ